jgi:serine/threonine protein kinase/tetratricopeptide (TPR) repeat protein
MTPDDWQHLKPLFGDALAKSPKERAIYVDEIKRAAPSLGRQLESLLRANEQETFLTNQPVFRLEAITAEEVPLFSAGEVVLGRFKIARLVGSGGMGDVYEANDEATGRVALKTIRPDLAHNERMLSRFRQEVQLAQRISSPHVCRIHDLHIIPSSPRTPASVFLTMEFLEGVSLAKRIADQGAMPWKEAEGIALQLCSGLSAIHGAGIVHRDLKSNNIMLSSRSGLPNAVVMDFGLAVEAVRDQPDASTVTAARGIEGTTEYMAPEQFEGQFQLTPAADIYALGVVLYEMVTGVRLFKGSSHLAIAVRRAKRRQPASTIQAGLPDRWDEVIDRCLEYEPESRYQSAEAVAHGLQQSPSWARALWRMPIAFKLLGLAMVVALVCLLAWLYATSSRTRSQQMQIAVLPFEDLSHDPVDQAFCDGLTEVLVSQLAELERFQGSLLVIPSGEVRHQKISSAGDAYRLWRVNFVVTGSVQRSNRSLRLIVNLIDAKAVKQLRSKAILVPESEPIAMQNGVVSQVADLLDLQLAPQARRLLSVGATTVPGAYEYYLQGYGYLRQFGGVPTIDQAIDEFKHALALDPSYALAHAGLGEAYWTKYMLTKDHDLLDKAWVSCRQALRLNDGIAAAHNTLGLLYAGTGDYQGALAEYQRALSIDPNSRDAFSGVAGVYERMGKLDEAEATFKEAIALRPDYWNGYVRLATFYKRHGRYGDALLPLQKVTELVPDNPIGHFDLGGIYQLLGRDQLAESEYQKSLEIRPTAPGYSDLASFYFYRSRFADAARLYQQAVTLSPGTFDYWGNLGDAYRWLGDKTKAQQAYQKAIALCRESLNVNKADVIAMGSLASYLAKSGDRELAIKQAQNATKLAAGNSDVLYDVALAYELAGDRAKAITALKEAIARGYSPTIARQEPDLARLRADPAFGEIFKREPRR